MTRAFTRINEGDVVRLKCGGALMVVCIVNWLGAEMESDVDVTCVWQDRGGVPHKETYPMWLLRHVSRHEMIFEDLGGDGAKIAADPFACALLDAAQQGAAS